MNCPKCQEKMKVTHSYSASTGRSQRLACDCGLVGIAVTVMVATDPVSGEGVHATLERLKKAKTPPSLLWAEEDGADEMPASPTAGQSS